MIYTITTRTRKRGIFFEPHELEPLGISSGSWCWGVFVEGRQWADHLRFDRLANEPWLDQQTPHLLISPMHPDYWPTAFTIQVLLQRRRFKQGADCPEYYDSFFGVADALSRCGVNILFVQTAQVGYDLMSFTATCELPHLRGVAAQLVDRADRAGVELEERRRAQHIGEGSSNPAVHKSESEAYKERAASFQKLGQLMMLRLAELEARLLLIEQFRYWWDRHVEERARIEAHYCNNEIYKLIVGEDPNGGMDHRLKQFREAVSMPWFCNSKVVEAGENSYFLAYHSFEDRENRRAGRTLGPSTRTDSSEKGELSLEELDALYDHTLALLQKRPLHEPLDSVMPPSPGSGDAAGSKLRRSGTAERTQHITDGAAFERKSNRDFFRRQALMPVTVAALPSLAYARFWAFGGAKGKGEPIAFDYKHNVLTPQRTSSGREVNMVDLFSFLNEATHCTRGIAGGEFAPQSAVLVNINLKDRFARLRFVRDEIEPFSFSTLRVRYKASGSGPWGANSQGLLREVVRLLIEQGFRVENVINKVTNSARANLASEQCIEEGQIELVVKAVTPKAVKLQRDGGIKALMEEWGKAISSSELLEGRAIETGDPIIESGFAPPDR